MSNVQLDGTVALAEDRKTIYFRPAGADSDVRFRVKRGASPWMASDLKTPRAARAWGALHFAATARGVGATFVIDFISPLPEVNST